MVGPEISTSFLRFRRKQKNQMAAMAAIPPTTPTMMPAIAPPPTPELLELFEAPSAMADDAAEDDLAEVEDGLADAEPDADAEAP